MDDNNNDDDVNDDNDDDDGGGDNVNEDDKDDLKLLSVSKEFCCRKNCFGRKKFLAKFS